MMGELPTPEQVHSVLQQFLTPDTKLVQEATIWLRNYLQIPDSIPVMFQILEHGNDPCIRQASAVVLRSWIVKHWQKMDPSILVSLKQTLLKVVVNESLAIVRKALSELIVIVARFTLPLNNWPEFWPTMFELVNTSNPSHLQLVLIIIERLAEKIFDQMSPMIDDFVHLYQICLQPNQDPHVRLTALKSSGVCIAQLDIIHPLVHKFQVLIPAMINVLEFCINQGADQETIDGLTTFQSIIDSCSVILEDNLVQLTEYILSIGANQNASIEVRQEALMFVQCVVQFCTSSVVKSKLLNTIITVGFQIAAEPEEQGQYAQWETTPHTLALQSISSIAAFVKPKLVFNAIMPYVDQGIQSQNAWERRSAIGILSSITFGCCEIISQDLEKFHPYLLVSFRDQDPYVRRAACILLGQYAEHLVTNFVDFGPTVLPLSFEAMNEEDPEIQDRAIYSVMTFVEHMEPDDITPYLDTMMSQLANILSRTNSTERKELIIETIGTIASAALDKFMPYWEATVKHLQPLMDITDGNLLGLRGHAIDCVGVIALSISKDLFQPYYHHFMEKAIQGLDIPNIDGSELREYTINFFANICESLQADFLPYLPTCLDIILKSLKNADGSKPELTDDQRQMASLLLSDNEEDGIEGQLEIGSASDSNNPYHQMGDEELDDDANSEFADDPDALDYVINDNFIEEKGYALRALGTFAHVLGPLWVPYIDQCMPVLKETSKYIQPKIRTNSIYPMEAFAVCISMAHPSPSPWSPGLSPEQHPLSRETSNYVLPFVVELIRRIPVDFDLTAVNRYVISLKFLLEKLGAPAIHPHMNEIYDIVQNLFNMETRAQITEAIDGDEENEEVQQDLFALFDSTCDLVVALAKAYHQLIMPWFGFFEILANQLEIYSGEDADPSLFRQAILGSLAEILESVRVESFDNEQILLFLTSALKLSQVDHACTKGNAVYLLRLCSTHPVSMEYYANMFEQVIPLLQSTDSQLHDNAMGCIGSIILTAAYHIPLPHIIPPLLAAFPLVSDAVESKPAYGALIYLVEQGHASILPHIDQTFKILVSDINRECIEDEVKPKMRQTVSLLWNQFSNNLQGVVSQFDANQTNNFHYCINS